MDSETSSALFALADSWSKRALDARNKADSGRDQLVSAKRYGKSDSLDEAARELRALVRELMNGSDS